MEIPIPIPIAMKTIPPRFLRKILPLATAGITAAVLASVWLSTHVRRGTGEIVREGGRSWVEAHEPARPQPGLEAPAPAFPGGSGGASGRNAIPFDIGSLSSLSQAKRGDIVALPVPGGWKVSATVNLVQTDSDGAVRIGGAVPGGTFFLSVSGNRMRGMIPLPAKELAYMIEVDAGGTRTIREKPLSEVVCMNMPDPDEPPGPEEPSPAPLPEAAPPILSSRPGATAVVYLDFDGETVVDPAWNGGNPVVAAPANLTPAEITESWTRVKEDFWPFDIDVTTDPQRYLNAPVGRRMRAIISPPTRPGPAPVELRISTASR